MKEFTKYTLNNFAPTMFKLINWALYACLINF